MKKQLFVICALAWALPLSAGPSLAADPAVPPAQAEEQIYGSQLMTPQERAEQRAKMRAAKTVEEREKIRQEHHDRMKARAKARGITLPDEPPMGGAGMGPGGMGPGPGGGMGPRGGRY